MSVAQRFGQAFTQEKVKFVFNTHQTFFSIIVLIKHLDAYDDSATVWRETVYTQNLLMASKHSINLKNAANKTILPYPQKPLTHHACI